MANRSLSNWLFENFRYVAIAVGFSFLLFAFVRESREAQRKRNDVSQCIEQSTGMSAFKERIPIEKTPPRARITLESKDLRVDVNDIVGRLKHHGFTTLELQEIEVANDARKPVAMFRSETCHIEIIVQKYSYKPSEITLLVRSHFL
jgi:hypothetical protein